MNIYTVSGDTRNYRSLEVLPGEPVPQYLADETLQRGRGPAHCRWVDSSLPVAPFIPFLPTAFAIDVDALARVDDSGNPDVPDLLTLCEMGADPHVLDVESRRNYWAIDVMTVCNALDRANTLWHEGGKGDWFGGVRRYAFHADRIGLGVGLFKLPVNEPSPVLAFDTVPGRKEATFLERYRACAATGLTFTQVWSDDSSAAAPGSGA